MRTATRLLLSSLAITPLTGRASAQRCLGAEGFENSHYRVGVVGLAGDGMKGWAVTGASGTVNADFLKLRIGQSDFSSVPFTVTSWSAVTGYQIPVAGSMQMELCPFAIALNDKGSGTTGTGGRTGINSNTIGVGGAIG